MTDDRTQYNPRAYSRIPSQPRIRYNETEEEKETPDKFKGTPFEGMTFDQMMTLGLVVAGAVVGAALSGGFIGWFGGSLVGFKTGAWWGRRSTKSK